MEYIRYIVIIALVIYVIMRMMPAKGINNITTDELKDELKKKDKQFIDVRTPGEYRNGHIKQFKNIPLNTIGRVGPKQLDKEKEVILICQSGVRSQRAAKVLKRKGFTNITNVRGGVGAWR